MRPLSFVLLAVAALSAVTGALTPTSYLTPADRDRLKGVFSAGLASEADAGYAVLGLGLLGEAVPNTVCAKLTAGMKGSVGAVQVAAQAAKVAKCGGSKASGEAAQVKYKIRKKSKGIF